MMPHPFLFVDRLLMMVAEGSLLSRVRNRDENLASAR
jgi:hypothetical protein